MRKPDIDKGVFGIMNFGEENGSALGRAELEAVLSSTAAGIAVVCAHPKGIKILYTNDGFYDIFGYTREEYGNLSDEELMSLIDGDDLARIFNFVNSDYSAYKEGLITRIEFRVRRKDGATAWILLSVGKPHIKLFDRNCFVCNIVDITETKNLLLSLEKEKERYGILSELSDNIFFTYDFADDVFESSHKPENDDRLSERCENASEVIKQGGVFDKRDIPAFEYAVNQAVSGQSVTVFDARLLGGSGEKIWYRIKFRTVYGANGQAQRFVGTMININGIVEERQRLIEKARTDELTGCLNKTAVQQKTEDIIRNSNGLCGALMLIDIDDFKYLNDHYGHACGDEFLRLFAGEISQCIGEDDVFGRAGGDEFVVFVSDKENAAQSAGETARRIADACAHLRAGEMNDAVTCSVGISLFPLDGTDYLSLFEKADSAMYKQKKNGKKGYSFYK